MISSEISLKDRIEEFLSQHRFAMAGVSRKSSDFSRELLRELLKRGYDVVPVHPSCEEMEGRKCATSMGAITPRVEGVLLMTPPSVTEALVRECPAAGIRRVWMYRAAGKGAVSPRAVEFCQSNGIDVVPGECPFMFLPDTGIVHRFHGFVRKIIGSYPR